MVNPIYALISKLLRLTYGDSLAYTDGGHGGAFADRAEAALALVEDGAVSYRRVAVMRGKQRVRETVSLSVVSQEHKRKVRYSVSLGEPHSCECEDFHRRGGACKHTLAAMIALALDAAFEELPPVQKDASPETKEPPPAPAPGRSVRVAADEATEAAIDAMFTRW